MSYQDSAICLLSTDWKLEPLRVRCDHHHSFASPLHSGKVCAIAFPRPPAIHGEERVQQIDAWSIFWTTKQ